MSQKELQRIKVVESAVEGRLSVAEAAELLQLSTRQVKQLKCDYDPAHAEWVHHGNQDRSPPNAIASNLRNRVIELAKWQICGVQRHSSARKADPSGRFDHEPSQRPPYPAGCLNPITAKTASTEVPLTPRATAAGRVLHGHGSGSVAR